MAYMLNYHLLTECEIPRNVCCINFRWQRMDVRVGGGRTTPGGGGGGGRTPRTPGTPGTPGRLRGSSAPVTPGTYQALNKHLPIIFLRKKGATLKGTWVKWSRKRFLDSSSVHFPPSGRQNILLQVACLLNVVLRPKNLLLRPHSHYYNSDQTN